MPDESVSLRDYFERVLIEMEHRYQQRFESQERALTESRVTLSKRLDGLNENRSTVADLVGRCITREEARSMVIMYSTLAGSVTAAVTLIITMMLSFVIHR